MGRERNGKKTERERDKTKKRRKRYKVCGGASILAVGQGQGAHRDLLKHY